MITGLLSETFKEGGGGGGGGGDCNEDEPISRGYVLPDQADFWLSIISCFS